MPDDNPATDNAQLHAAEARRLLLDALNTVSKEHNSIYAAFMSAPAQQEVSSMTCPACQAQMSRLPNGNWYCPKPARPGCRRRLDDAAFAAAVRRHNARRNR